MKEECLIALVRVPLKVSPLFAALPVSMRIKHLHLFCNPAVISNQNYFVPKHSDIIQKPEIFSAVIK